MALWQVLAGGERRLARGPAGQGPQELLAASLTIDGLLGGAPGTLAAALRGLAAGPVPPGARVVAPVGGQEVWAAGVTYTRSLDARVAESGTPDPYERVYGAERPELFLKAAPGRVRGPGEPVGIRADSTWDVPEPELAVVADTVKVADLHRSPGELVRWLFRALDFPVGVVLLTGTAIVPPPAFTLRAGDEVIIATTGLGELRNVVEVIEPSPSAG